jgi:hypothetical protein
MALVVSYLIGFLVVLGWALSVQLRGFLPEWMESLDLAYTCVLSGGLGGSIYCLRAVYLNRSVRGEWDPRWTVWYVLRPLVSSLVGGVAYVFLRAGLLILDSPPEPGSSTAGFLALSFIAGLNVDRFLVRLEDIAQSTWGIRASRTAERSKKASDE